jgi:hypothetical protein
MSFWNQLVAGVPTVLLGGLTIALGAAIIWVATRIARGVRGGFPGFLLRRAANGDWFLERTGRRTALDVAKGSGTIGTTGTIFDLRQATAPAYFGDMQYRKKVQVAQDGETMFLTWIEGGSWRFSSSVHLADDVKEHPVFAKRNEKRGVSTD